MRRFLILLFTILSVSLLFSNPVFARADSTALPSDMMLPNSYLEYYRLNAPQDVWTDGNEYVICETGKIIYFDGALFNEYDLSEYSISKVYKVNDFILFLSSSKIYSINLSTSEIKEESAIYAGTSFYVQGSTLITNPSSEIRYYTFSAENSVFSVEELSIKRKSLTFTPSVLALDSDQTLYYMHEGSLYKISDANSEVLASDISNARSLSISDYIFISFEDGIKKLDKSGNTLSFLPISGERNLSNISHPRGIFYCDQKLYIADDNLNAILRYDLQTDKLSDFYITTNHNASGRISQDAKSIFATEKTVYVLDTNYIKAIDVETEKVSEITLSGFSGLKMLASTNNTFLLSSGTNLILAKVKGNTLESIEISGNISRLENVSALATFENDYYVLNNETVNNQQRAVVYKLSSTNPVLTQHSTVAGRGDALTTDVFGDVYVEVYNEADAKFYVYATDVSASKHKQISVSQDKMIAMFADYEGSLFGLLENNTVTKTTPNSTVNNEISLSDNLPSSSFAIDFSVYQGSNFAYFLYKGFVLKISTEALSISTPQQIPVPDDFEIKFIENPAYVTLKNGAKMFEVSLDSAPDFGEYFDYKTMRANKDENVKYVEIARTGRYSLILNDKTCAIARTEDTVSSTVEKTALNEYAYAVNDISFYAYPVIKEFTSILSISKNDLVTVKETFAFNDFEFALVEKDGNFGYVAKSMLKQGIASNLTSLEVKSKLVTQNSTLFFDEELSSEIKKIEKGTLIALLSEKDGVSTVLYDGKVCYIESSALIDKNTQVLKNICVVALLFIALLSSGIYLVKTLLNKKGLKR